MELRAAAAGAAVLACLLYGPGWAAARALGLRRDLFACVWCGLGATSIGGLLLAQAGVFSLGVLFGTLAAASVAALLIGSLWPRDPTKGRAAAMAREGGAAEVGDRGAAGVRALACAAAVGAMVSCWPPFETVIAASDSTMYVNAGIHLARTGSLVVTDSVARLLGPFTARTVFPSLRWGWRGPFIRLPGGLLTADLASGRATPAFFPLTSVWAAIPVAAGGPEAAPLAAPLFVGLAVWSIVLFAGETFGAVAATATALLVLADFAFWWFGRFLMSEPLVCAFLWGGLVFLGRHTRREDGSAFAAGIMLGLAGLARTETFLFVVAAGALCWAWARVRVVTGALLTGFALVLALTAVTVGTSPNHHVAYLANEVGMELLIWKPEIAAARSDGRLAVAAALLGAVVVAAGFVGRRRGIGFLRGTSRALTLLTVAVAALVYMKLGGAVHPLRYLSRLAAYCTWELLALAAVGGVAVWRRGGPVARFAVVLWFLVAMIFLANPRVAPYQPWAIRRFLPVVIPGVTIAAAAGLALLAAASGRVLERAVLIVALAVAFLEVRPILAVRGQPFFAGSFAAARALADLVPADAIVVIDDDFADVQIQVPLWLVHGRETVMVNGGGTPWRKVMTTLVAGTRPVYWITSRYAPPPTAPGLVFSVVVPDHEIRVPLPQVTVDALPAQGVIQIVPLRIYGAASAAGRPAPPPSAAGLASAVGVGLANSARSIPLRFAYSSGVCRKRMSWNLAFSPLASTAVTKTSVMPSLVYVCVTVSPVSGGEPSPKSQVKV